MDDQTNEINELFAAPNTTIERDVLGELKSILRIHSLSPQELFFKWEAYSLKMGSDTLMNYQTARDFKKDLQGALERESRAKAHMQSAQKRGTNGTPRNAATGDVFGVLDGLVGTPSRGPVMKRRNDFGTPSAKASKLNNTSSPAGDKTPTLGATNEAPQLGAIPFAERQNAGQIVEQLNGHIELPTAPSSAPVEPRVKLKANTDMGKFGYRPMAMKLSEASEFLDERIDEFVDIVQKHHQLEYSAFGNPAAMSPAQIVAVGRIALDTSEGRMNAASMVLETSRRMGAGLRVPLRMEKGAYDFFPGKIVAVRGNNPSGEYFSVTENLSVPSLLLPATAPTGIDVHNERLQSDDGTETRPLNILIGAGPYTTDSDLSFDSLHELCSQAAETKADLLVLSGPFIDIEHPKVASGDFSLPPDSKIDSSTATLTDVFRAFISQPLSRLAQTLPGITIILVPSVRDAVSKHISWPQDRLNRKELGLPKQATCVTNPMTVSCNDFMTAVSSQDVLFEMQRQRVVSGLNSDALASLARNLLTQRHYFPVFPPLPRDEKALTVGASLDVAYLKLGEILNVSPDLLILPSVLTPFVKVVDGVLVVNPGTASKKRGAGTYAKLIVGPRELTEDEREKDEEVDHQLFNRARCDIIRI
ncbi:DNA polymerase alpha, subunit B [Aureobasidium pullulans]|uniref:DNA polymerase alpha subunit B n=1 Tax=Aureobasidium pullulans TaxID=5580 RepID=A0A4S9DBM6_AURPU|nr:DNA polymerase alpha, subunit B [Aureobasidium pullulans]